MMAESVLTEVRGRVLLITLNRPEARNAIDTSLAQGLLAAATRLDGDSGLTVGVIAGNGPGFSSGMDLKAFAREGPPQGLVEFITRGTSKPLIAAIEGFAIAGGLELALTCDLLVAGRSARLGISEARVGLFAAGGALLRLPRRLPYGVAMELALTAEPMSAVDAHSYGLVTRLADDGSAVDVAFDLADRIARNAPLAVAASKQLLRETQGRTEAEFWDFQAPFIERVFGSEDAREGPSAFAEKRPAVWSGR